MSASMNYQSQNSQSSQNYRALSATGGSLVVCLVTSAAVYLAADSRYANAPPRIRDSARKLILCGPTALCGLSGLVRFTRTEYDRHGNHLGRESTFELSDVVEKLRFENAAGVEPELASWFAKRLHQELAPIWERFAIDLDELPFEDNGQQGKSMDTLSLRLAQLFYVNREGSSRTFLATIDLTHSLRRSKSGRYSCVLEEPVVRRLFFGAVSDPCLYVRGARRCVRPEPRCGSVEGDAEALRIIDGIFARARHVGHCAAAIGGPVDVAVIDSSGRRWLKQKQKWGVAILRNRRRDMSGRMPCSLTSDTTLFDPESGSRVRGHTNRIG
jgi:hypothetical protein